MHHPKVANFQLTPKWVAHTGAGAPETQAAYVAVFTPEDKGKPARVAAYCVTLPAAGADAGAGAGSAAEMAALSVDTKPCATRTVFAASEARLLFSPSCRTLLVYTQSDVDTTGASYFGATGLFVMAMDGSLAEQVHPSPMCVQYIPHFLYVAPINPCFRPRASGSVHLTDPFLARLCPYVCALQISKVTQSKAGPVYDVQWSPIDDVFVVAAGTMPAHCTLYNNKVRTGGELIAAVSLVVDTGLIYTGAIIRTRH